MWQCMQYCICALSLSRFYNCLLRDWYTRQYLRTESGNVHVFIQGRRGGPVKIFAPPPIPAMVMRIMLSCDKTNKQASNKQTSTWRTKPHQAQSEVNWMAITSCGECLDYLFYCMMKWREDWAALQRGVYLLACLIVFHDNLSLCWLHVWSTGNCHRTPCSNIFKD